MLSRRLKIALFACGAMLVSTTISLAQPAGKTVPTKPETGKVTPGKPVPGKPPEPGKPGPAKPTTRSAREALGIGEGEPKKPTPKPGPVQPDVDIPGLTPRQKQLLASIKWQEGPTDGKLGTVATIKVPKGYQFTDGNGARAYMELNGNPPNPDMLGLLEPTDSETDSWLITFSYEDVGYVKDDEKDKIDANAILESIKAGNEEGNKHRAKLGVPPLTVVGWDKPPFYDTKTNRLTWAIRGQTEGHFVVNYNSRILGRGGVMSANLIVDPNDLQKTLPTYESLLTGYTYNPGQTYAEFKEGDRVAQYGLTALVAGGAFAVAAKTGLLGKLLKPLIVVGVLLIGGIAKAWGALFGKKTNTEQA